MKYEFENERAIDLYFEITRVHGIKLTPGENFKREGKVEIKEAVMQTFLDDIQGGKTTGIRAVELSAIPQ